MFPKGKQLSSKALVNLVTTQTRASVRAWKLSGVGTGMEDNWNFGSQGEQVRWAKSLGQTDSHETAEGGRLVMGSDAMEKKRGERLPGHQTRLLDFYRKTESDRRAASPSAAEAEDTAWAGCAFLFGGDPPKWL